MSNLIKADSVVVGVPLSLEVVLPTQSNLPLFSIDNEGRKTEQAGFVAEVLGHAGQEADRVFDSARNRGEVDGYAQGMKEQKQEFFNKKQEAEQAARYKIEKRQLECDNAYAAAQEQNRCEARAFAFLLAGKILGKKIDEEAARFAGFFDESSRFDSCKPDNGPKAILTDRSIA